MLDTSTLLQRANSLCGSVPITTRARAIELATNVLWMEHKLDEAREEIADAPLSVEYDNGGGQCGTRKNPSMDAYNALMATYTRAMKQLCEMLGVQEVDGGDDDLDAILANTTKTRATRAN